ncbi:glycosyltransferase family 2 protein [Bacteroidota bacterium]
MGFADRYLQKHAIREPIIKQEPDQDLSCIITIPAFNESRLTECLDSLFACNPSGSRSEVIMLINEPENCEEVIHSCNIMSFKSASEWISNHKREDISFHIAYVSELPNKHFGAGLARKLVMDEAIHRFNRINHPEGIILSLDADTKVEPNYISAIQEHFSHYPKASGCAIQFRHPTSGDEFEPAVYQAAVKYESHLNYYVKAIRSTGYPYGFHTIGSCFAVRASAYCNQGGMNKRKAGEDFYFIQKVAMQGNFTECNTTTVYPSPRPSDRVVFGTGPEIQKQLQQPHLPYLTFAPVLFDHLRTFYQMAPGLFASTDSSTFLDALHPILREFLLKKNFETELLEIQKNVSSEQNFSRRFHRKFNMFWILKYLHFAESKGIDKVPVESAAEELQRRMSNSL